MAMDDNPPNTATGPRIVAAGPQPEPVSAEPTSPPPRARAPGGFWSFVKTLFVGTAGLAVLGVVGTLAGSAWLTANQRAEAEKSQPWADPPFTTTAVTTGGILARWMDNDGNLENGHSYIKGIYDLWTTKHPRLVAELQSGLVPVPQLWQIEINSQIRFMAERERIRKDLATSKVDRENFDAGIAASETFAKELAKKYGARK